MLNTCTLMGRLVRDPELRHTQSGTPVASFTLAVDRDFTPKDAEKETDFIDFIAWRGTAEFVSKYFSKGRMAVVAGRIQVRNWKDRDDKTRKAVEIVAENVYFGDSKKDGDSSPYRAPAPQAGGGTSYQQPISGSQFEELEDDDGELPF